MLEFSGLNEEQYDSSAQIIIYGKLIEKLVEDFVTREDMKVVMKSSNLPVSTVVTTAVQVAIPAGTGTGNGKGTGQTSPIYVADMPSPGSEILKQRRISEKEAGYIKEEGQTSIIKNIAGV